MRKVFALLVGVPLFALATAGAVVCGIVAVIGYVFIIASAACFGFASAVAEYFDCGKD